MTLTDVLENWAKNNELLKNLKIEIFRYSNIGAMDALNFTIIYTIYINDNYVKYWRGNNKTINIYASDPKFFEKLENCMIFLQ